MATAQASIVLRHIRGLVAAETTGDLPDPQLLQRFLTGHEEAAFEALVRRHGPLVWGVCRRVLGNWHDAEDVFQAAFLVLARKASSISKHESVGSWLYRVAYHLAVKAKARSVRQRQAAQTTKHPTGDPFAEVTGRELLTVLDEELQALPERYRAPLVLCYLEDHTRDEAARRLGWSLATLKLRLKQARERLHSRLARRGLALPSVLLTPGVWPNTAAAVPTRLTTSTVSAGLQWAAGKSTGGLTSVQAVALTESALRTLLLSKWKLAAVCLLLASLAALGIGAFMRPARAPRQEGTTVAETSGLQPAQDKGKHSTVTPSAESKEQVTLTGSVLAASGKPLAGAKLAVLLPKGVAGKAQADAEGRFRLSVPRAAVKDLGDNPTLTVLALAKGHGVGWETVQVKKNQAEIVFRLVSEVPLRVRLVDLQGVATAGVKVHLSRVHRESDKAFKGVSSYSPAGGSPFWPASATTDKDGYFVVHGLRGKMSVAAHVNDDRFALNDLSFEVGVKDPAAVVLTPPRWIEGQVVDGDTRKPVSGAEVTVNGGGVGRFVNGKFEEEESLKIQVVHSDKEGRFRCNHYARRHYHFNIKPPKGAPYFMSMVQSPVDWSGSLKVKHTLVLPLKRGILQTGKVVDADTGKPLAGAQIYYVPQLWDNPLYKGAPEDFWGRYHGIADTDSDGTFAVAVLPGTGHLRIRKYPYHDHVKYGITFGRLTRGKDEGEYWFDHDWVKLDIKPDVKPAGVVAKIQRGVCLPGQLTGPDGKPVAKVSVLVLSISDGRHREVPVAIDEGGPGRFELRCGDPAVTYRLLFFDSKTQSGAVAEIVGKQPPGKMLTVALKPYGSAVARFVDAQSKGIEKYQPQLWIQESIKGVDGKPKTIRVPAPLEKQAPVTDAEGRCRFTNLVPGITYVISDGDGTRTFVVESGKTLDLGTLKISRGK
jgi:RNA polymerase sigma factor (sigma-70 family)